MFIDIGCYQEKKYGQNAFGDYFLSRRHPDEGRVLAVLSDGLGSGVKASILARMTATMLLGFVEEEIEIKKAAEIMMNSLPVCQVRKISYATFSILECDEQGNVRVVEEGNPDFIWMRGGRLLTPEHSLLRSSSFPERHMKIYRFQAEQGDRLIFCSDGVTQAGLGQPGPRNLGQGRDGLVAILKSVLNSQTGVDSAKLARFVVSRSVAICPDGKAHDDISAVVVHFRTPRRALVFSGTPFDPSRDAEYAGVFERFKGRKAICGGTTASIVARELGLPLVMMDQTPEGGLPPAARMKGADLVTEGIITLTRALGYLESMNLEGKDPAADLANFLLESDTIHFLEGSSLNSANFDPKLDNDFDIRRNVVRKLSDVLMKKYLKKVTVQRI